MKYIRADLLWNKIAESAFFSVAEKGKIRAAIEEEPGEDVKPVVPAHVVWAKTNISYQTQCCSNCHRTFISRPDETIQFCPHCGSKMDEEGMNT